MRAVRGHSGWSKADPSLQDNVEIPYNWIDYIYHVGSSHDCKYLIRSGLTAGGKDSKKGGQTVLFTAVDPVNEPQKDERHDETKSTERYGKCTRTQCIGSICQVLKTEDLHFGEDAPVLSSLITMYQPNALKKWYIPNLKKFKIKRFICRRFCDQQMS